MEKLNILLNGIEINDRSQERYVNLARNFSDVPCESGFLCVFYYLFSAMPEKDELK